MDIGWDTQATSGTDVSHAEKLREINGQFHIAVAGYARYSDILQYADVPEIHKADFESDDYDVRGWLITRAVPAWIEALKESEKEHLEKEDWSNGVALIIVRGKIYSLGPDFSITQYPEFGGIGSGSDYAKGALAAGATIKQALKVAADLDPYTGGELRILKGV